MGRFARTVGGDLQHELLFFYFEPVEDGSSNGTRRLEPSASERVIARAERAFAIRPQPQSPQGMGEKR